MQSPFALVLLSPLSANVSAIVESSGTGLSVGDGFVRRLASAMVSGHG